MAYSHWTKTLSNGKLVLNQNTFQWHAHTEQKHLPIARLHWTKSLTNGMLTVNQNID